MKDLIKSKIDWSMVSEKPAETFRFDIQSVRITEDGMPEILIASNFVMPTVCEEAAAAAILAQVPSAREVRFAYRYDQLAQSRAESVRCMLPRMSREINGEYAAITKMILPERVETEGDRIRLYVLGEAAAAELNGSVAAQYAQILKRELGITADIEFCNDETGCSRLQEQLQKEEAEAAERARIAAGKAAGKASAAKSTGRRASAAGRSGGSAPRGNRLLGRAIKGNSEPLSSLNEESGEIVVEGELFRTDVRAMNDKRMVKLLVTDRKTTICAKFFVSGEKWGSIEEELTPGVMLKIHGAAQWDTFDNCTVVMARDIEKVGEAGSEERQDNAPVKRCELHAHTKMSNLDGMNVPADMVKLAAAWGQPAIAITDHGVVQAFPEAMKTAKELAASGKPIKILYGMEGYLLDDADCLCADGRIDYKSKKTNHVVLLARTQEGMLNLYKLVSESHLHYFYKRPRLPKSVIADYREGILVGAACEAGEVFRAVRDGKSMEEQLRIASFYDYLEVQPLCNNSFMVEQGIVDSVEDLKELNRKVIALGEAAGIPVCATCDAHYQDPEDALYRKILQAGQGFKDVEGDKGLYLRTTEEMLDEFSYLAPEKAYEIVVTNPNKIADRIEEVTPIKKGKFPPKIKNADETLRTTCIERAKEIYGEPVPPEIAERLKKELDSIIGNGYAVMYVSAQMLVKKSNADGYLVGSRGSVGSSFAATMAGITEVNPLAPHYICPECKKLEWGKDLGFDGDCGVDMMPRKCPVCGAEMERNGFQIPFETFLGFEGDKEPDIDLNFAGEYQPRAHKYVEEVFGQSNVFRAGTISTIADKTAYGFVRKYFEDRGIPVSKWEIDRLTVHCTGVRRTTGQHPGGVIIVPADHTIFEFCPIQHPANDASSGIITTHYEYHSIDQNLLKLDILGHDVPSQIRMLQDFTGRDPLTVSLSDPKVNSIFLGTEGLDILDKDYRFTHGSYGIPEFGTRFVRQMLDDTKPDTFSALVRISGFSHGTDVWINNAQEFIRSGVATMKDAISTRDDIMNYLIGKGLPKQNSFKIMEGVRKGKGLKEDQEAMMREHEVPDWYIESCKRIKYMFPRAHAVAYVMMSYRIASYKVYYPLAFYSVYFTIHADAFDAETVLKGKPAVLAKMELLEAKGRNATQKEEEGLNVLELVYEMFARGYEFLPARLGMSEAVRFRPEAGKVLMPLVALAGVGENAAKAIASEYEKKPFETIEELRNRAKANKTAIEALRAHGALEGLSESDQLSFF